MSVPRAVLLTQNSHSIPFLCFSARTGASTSDGCGINPAAGATVRTVNDSDAAPPPPAPSGVPAAETEPVRGRLAWLSAVALPAAVASAGAGAVLLLHFRDPHVPGSYGLCPSYALFGVYCPGCGGMRAVHNLTEGNIIDSLHSNLLALPVLVLFALWVGDWAVRAWRGEGPRLPGIGTGTMWVLLGSLAAYAVLRNTPWGTWLTPV
ncbi:DUF2752 domain-containing protein [Nocardia flavorosea]|nr:DUF2752 domain-containing protein [Nocardia flavorosea]